MKPSILFGAVVLLLSGCGGNKLDVDISEIKTAPLKVRRLDQDLFSLNGPDFEAKSNEIKARYGAYYERYLSAFALINRKGSRDSLYKLSVLKFIYDKDIGETHQYIQKLYPDSKINEIGAEVNACVKRFAYHFPKRKLPTQLVTCLSGWNYAFGYTDSTLAISLDMYLGDTAKFYEMLRFPQYLTKKMNEHYILPDLARGWLLMEFDTTLENSLIAHTVFWGKIFYGVNALLPRANDSLIIGYTGKQLKYCHDYEKSLWSYFAEKNRLYENSRQNVHELTSDGPFSGAISKECPPRIAMWVGWQIVKSYMKNNDKVSLEQLMKEDASKVLNKSKYRP